MTNLENAENLAKRIKAEIVTPGGMAARVTTLGGVERPSVCITLAFDPRVTWEGGILENSKFAKILVHFGADGTGRFAAASCNRVTPIRQVRVKNSEEAFLKLQKWVATHS